MRAKAVVAWTRRSEMKIGTDLQRTGVGDITGKILVVQPKGVNGRVFDYNNVFNNTLNLKALIHTGTLGYGPYFDSNPLFDFVPCGGGIRVLSMGETPQWFRDAMKDEDVVPITCSNAQCKMQLRIYYSSASMQNVMLHLMIKQMFLGWKSFYYLDCGAYKFERWSHSHISREEQQIMNELGVISMIPQCCWGQLVDSPRTHHFDFGFTLKPGIKSGNDFDGYDGWARFLIGKKFEQLQNFLNHEGFPSVLGPRDPFHDQKR